MPTSKPTTPSATKTHAPKADSKTQPEAEIRELTAKFAPAHARLISAARRSLRKRLPTAHEIVYEYRDGFVISFSPSIHGYQGVLALRASADAVKLYFNQAKGLPDPEKLLQGSARQTRWISLEAAATLARPAVATLIDEAITRNRVPFARAGQGGGSVVRLTGAKKRSQRKHEKRLQSRASGSIS